ncbi:pyruvate phosphate dikinase, PEP/pyruvate binding domain protein [Clostridiales bacterium 1_7_47FAA]|uniref:PEP/pyruvate-binding domain-containing protein n=1 Tax=Enterocloster hominis (ex Hitch et al. 2024) TaxID=1917870 RepID=A0ABV1D6I0_9FIRM|nr:pyruvate phosphate dikinase, PEP/pyruvate binding domain protein [Clostridiales bacterium 1_7_47FAA]
MADYPDILKKEHLTNEERKCICNQMMTTESHMEQLILKHFTDEDFRKVWERKIGGGVIGGKACGLLVARKLIEQDMPECSGHIEPHNSFFVGTDVFYRYLVLNRCAELKARHTLEKEHFKETEELTSRLRNGMIPDDIREELADMLDHYGTTPIIVRSSSIMEDGYGNAFSGKYESIFCMNQGTKEERLEELEDAIRRVYASVMNEQAIEYRRKRHLLDVDEQMALLIQQVAGQAYGSFYFPAAAGMGCSYNPYKWMEYLNPEAGMLRMVAGLGTRAVERTPGDYPRLICLDRAQANLRTTMAERHKFSQRKVDVLDFATKQLCTKPLEQIIELLPKWQKKMVLSRDTEAEDMLAERHIYRKIYFADCQGLVDDMDFIHMMRALMKMLETAYGRPVDVEFAVTCPDEDRWKLNLLQCRPLQAARSEQVRIPEGVDHELLFDVRRTSMRRSKEERIDYIVWVDPQQYYEYTYAKKPDVARFIGRINQRFEDTDYKLMLLVPGRIGTSSPELGVPVAYSEISQFNAICEVAYDKAGYHPELSYGSHMFQDMVEADVYYGAINDNSKTRLYQPELLAGCPEILAGLCPEEPEMLRIVKLYDVRKCRASLTLDAHEGRAVCRIQGMQD